MNTLTHVGNLFAFIGGLGMFLYGMDIMASGLQKTAGNKMKDLLGYLTNNRILGVLVGALVTAIIQSSSATTVMVVGFVNAGIMNLTQAAGVIMGANVGTTITAWLVSANEWAGALKPDFFAPFILGIGAFIITFSNKQKMTQKAEIAVGFGILFIGLSSMSSSIGVYQDSPVFYKAFQVLGGNPILGIFVGAVVTAIIQSSSASVGILQTLAMRGIVNWRSAIFITLGQNIGTCITAILSSAGANKTAKRAAVIHLSFNVLGAAIYGVIMTIFFGIFPDLAMQHISSTQISIFHSIFNISVTILLFPFANALVKLSGLIIREEPVEDEEEEPEEKALRHLDPRILETPAAIMPAAPPPIMITFIDYFLLFNLILKFNSSFLSCCLKYFHNRNCLIQKFFCRLIIFFINDSCKICKFLCHAVVMLWSLIIFCDRCTNHRSCCIFYFFFDIFICINRL